MDMDMDVTRAKLDELLAVGTEHAGLDFKLTVDLKSHSETIELIKDVGAFMDHGGYLVIGANDYGAVQGGGGFKAGQAPLLDEANLRPVLEKYIPAPFTIATRVHDVEGTDVGLIQVLPHPHGACVFRTQGEYQHPKSGKQVVVFRANDIFTRHGTSSERVDGHDIERIRRKGVRAAPARPYPDMDIAALQEAVAEALRNRDRIAMIDVLDGLARVAENSVADADPDGLISALDKLTSVAATAIRYREDRWVDEVVGRLQAVYELGFQGSVRIPGGAPRFWLDVVDRVMAIGTLAVAGGRDDLIPGLVLRSPLGMDRNIYTNWITHAAVQVNRAGFLGAKSDRGEITFLRAVESELGMIEVVGAALRSADALQNALAQFDALAAITVWGRFLGGDDEYPYWPTFAGYYQDRYEPAIVRVIQNSPLRGELFGRSDDDLRRVLLILEEQGRRHLASFGGGGARYVAPEIHQFLQGE